MSGKRGWRSTILTQEDLNAQRCDCGCQEGGMCLHSRCHDDAPTWVWYQHETGALIVRCAECDSEIATIAVAARRSSEPPPNQLH